MGFRPGQLLPLAILSSTSSSHTLWPLSQIEIRKKELTWPRVCDHEEVKEERLLRQFLGDPHIVSRISTFIFLFLPAHHVIATRGSPRLTLSLSFDCRFSVHSFWAHTLRFYNIFPLLGPECKWTEIWPAVTFSLFFFQLLVLRLLIKTGKDRNLRAWAHSCKKKN